MASQYNLSISASLSANEYNLFRQLIQSKQVLSQYTFQKFSVLSSSQILPRPGDFNNINLSNSRPILQANRNVARRVNHVDRIRGFKEIFVWDLPPYEPQFKKENFLKKFFNDNFGPQSIKRIKFGNSPNIAYIEFEPEILDEIMKQLPVEIIEGYLREGDMSKYYSIPVTHSSSIRSNRAIKFHRTFAKWQNMKNYAKYSKIVRLGGLRFKDGSVNQREITPSKDEIISYFESNCGPVKNLKIKQDAAISSKLYCQIEFRDADSADKAVLIGDKQSLSANAPLLDVAKDFSVDNLDATSGNTLSPLSMQTSAQVAIAGAAIRESKRRREHVQEVERERSTASIGDREHGRQSTWTGLAASNAQQSGAGAYFGEAIGLSTSRQCFVKKIKLERESTIDSIEQFNSTLQNAVNESQTDIEIDVANNTLTMTVKEEIERTFSQEGGSSRPITSSQVRYTREENSFNPKTTPDIDFVRGEKEFGGFT